MTTAPRPKTMKSADMDLKPFMNLMVVLIPMLLLSAEFARVAVIDIQLPDDTGSTISDIQKTPPAETVSNTLRLTAVISDSSLTLGAKGSFLPSIYYREFYRYSSRDDHKEFTVEYQAGKPVVHPETGRVMTLQEREEILLYTCDKQHALQQRLYTPYGELITDVMGNPLASVSRGDSVYALSFPRRLIVVKHSDTFKKRPMSVYDALLNRLMKIRERYRDADDRDAIIIAAENGVIYDKIVQIMDTARKAQYPDISLSKLRS